MLLSIEVYHHNPTNIIKTVSWGIGKAVLSEVYKVYSGPDGTVFSGLSDCKCVDDIEDALWKLGFAEVVD